MVDTRDSDLVKRLISEGLRPTAAGTAKGHGRKKRAAAGGSASPQLVATGGDGDGGTRKSNDTVRLVSRVPLLFIVDGGKA
jgi:hypothetical protein